MDALPTPVYDVILDDGQGETTKHRVQVLNVDLVRFDRTAAKHDWPRADRAPMLWNTFVVWSAMRRTGAIPESLKWEQFEERALAVSPVPRDRLNGEGSDVVDPTLLEVEPV